MLSIEKSFWSNGIEFIAGVDEAGRGPLAGPVVSAAVVLRNGDYIEGVDDSKKLSSKKREILFEEIIKRALYFGIGIADENYIDEHNILNATFFSMKQAVDKLKHKPEYVIVDGNRLPDWDYSSRAIVKGDSLSMSIAAASIIAKVTRDRIMVEYDRSYPVYAFARHKGYATKHHMDIIKQEGLCSIHRRTFCRNILDRSQIEFHFLKK